MKPTLFWTLLDSYGILIPMRVTTEKPYRLYGSTTQTGATHCLARDATGRFKTEEAAQAMAGQIREVRQDFAMTRRRLEAALETLRKHESWAVGQVIRGLPPPGAPLAKELIALANE